MPSTRRWLKILRASSIVDYPLGWGYQTLLLHQAMRSKRRDEVTARDHLLVLEHAPVYTLGRGSDLEHIMSLTDDRMKDQLNGRGPHSARLSLPTSQQHLLDALMDSVGNHETTLVHATQSLLRLMQPIPVLAPTNQVPIYRVERGGQVTYHGPGQIVVYPLLDLVHYEQDLHWFLRKVEQVIIDTLRVDFGLDTADRDAEHTGVWIADRKIAAIGLSASRWITSHGFSINVNPMMEHFDAIRPCGIEGRGVTSMKQELGGRDIPMEFVTERLLDHFVRIFNVDLDGEEGVI